MDTGIVPSGELVSQADVDAVAATLHGWRAFALLQIGQTDRAEAELRVLWSQTDTDPVFARSLMMVVSAAGLGECAADMATSLQSRDGLSHDELRFPMPRLRPAGGFSIDPPLVYALTRLESNFDSAATSPVGARGLMQIMPATARYISDQIHAPDRLSEPAFNLEIGQRYIAYLARQDGIDNDLLRVLASYNSGPGNFARWGADMHDRDDPLLFIEAIPVPETRNFVRHALVYSWLYAARMHLPSSSLDALSAGEFPRFTPSVPRRRMALLTPGFH
jgi:soluble lytic murein transglycosylase-like protein